MLVFVQVVNSVCRCVGWELKSVVFLGVCFTHEVRAAGKKCGSGSSLGARYVTTRRHDAEVRGSDGGCSIQQHTIA